MIPTVRWQICALVGLGVVLTGLFFLIMRPPGGQVSMPGQGLPWQVTVGPGGATSMVFGVTLGVSSLRSAMALWGQRCDVGVFEDVTGRLSVEAYFREAVIGRLSARLVLDVRLPEATLAAVKTRAGEGTLVSSGGRRYAVAEEDREEVATGIIRAVTYIPLVKWDADLVQQRFGEPAERVAEEEGTHWLYPALGLDLLLGDHGEAVLQYVPPAEFNERLWAPLRGRGRQT